MNENLCFLLLVGYFRIKTGTCKQNINKKKKEKVEVVVKVVVDDEDERRKMNNRKGIYS